ncbi:MAG: hypothetical protein R3F43_26920 [bacterium]
MRWTADNHFAAWVGPADGDCARLAATSRGTGSPRRSSRCRWACATTFVAGWEAWGDAGSPQMMVGDVTGDDGLLLVTSEAAFEVVLGPAEANPGPPPGAPPAPEAVAAVVAVADADATGRRPRPRCPWAPAHGATPCSPPPTPAPGSSGSTRSTPRPPTPARPTRSFRSVAPIRPPPAGTSCRPPT